MYRLTSWITSLVVALTLSVGAYADGNPCMNVAGSLDVTVDENGATGTITGGLEGDVEITFGDEVGGAVTASIVGATTTITTEDGDIVTEDFILTVSLPGGLTLWQGRHVIVDGTGDFEGAVGGLATFGFYNGNNGMAQLSYSGLICFPE